MPLAISATQSFTSFKPLSRFRSSVTTPSLIQLDRTIIHRHEARTIAIGSMDARSLRGSMWAGGIVTNRSDSRTHELSIFLTRRRYDKDDLDSKSIAFGLRCPGGHRDRSDLAVRYGPHCGYPAAAAASATAGATTTATRRATTYDAEFAGGGRTSEGALAFELAHHEGRAMALDQPLVCGSSEELAARPVLFQRDARSHPMVNQKIANGALPGT